MGKSYKKTAAILVLVLSLAFIPGKEVNACVPAEDIYGKIRQLPNINRYDIFNSNKIKYVGHRGIRGLAPENTLSGFNLAGRLGYWGIECDVRTTRDGIWVILHDDTVDRMTNGTGPIKNLSLKEAESLIIDAGADISQYKEEKIPKLQDYLLICRKWGMVSIIEMKPGDNLQYYDKFLEIIKNYGDTKKIIVTSYSKTVLNKLRKLDNDLILGFICDNVNYSNINYVKKLGNAYIECIYTNVTKNAVDLCHENDIKLGAWNIDNKDIAENLIQTGVDIISTNFILPCVKN